MLRGGIPDAIGKFSRLKYFVASGNSITGEIPHTLGNMTQVIKLFVDENRLVGEIPASLGNCGRLEVLDLSWNRLNGTIPKEAIGRWSFSRHLHFVANRLTGTLPPEVGNCKNLITLDVSNNTLHGKIPSSLENCVMLESLCLQVNSFEGAIPSSLQKLKSMQVLDFAQNILSGQIPEFLGEFPLLTYLNLASNNFSGKVPIKGVFGNISEFSVDDNNELCGGIKPLGLPDCPTEIAKKRKSFPRRAVIATGKRPTDGMFTGDLSLREYVKTAMPDHVAEIAETWLNFEDEAAINQIGQSIGNIWKCLGSVLSIGLSCSADSPSERMNIKDVLRELQKAKNMLLGDQRRRGVHQRRR
ncbi:hypothetical protein V6N11_027868 [Hibiscus sabdariffa]|uniref:Uncharacterized protein n=1 Tax=Hibiscus sabdariffa TaxID=183260 RepID=A0ABR2NZN6_9ROSI